MNTIRTFTPIEEGYAVGRIITFSNALKEALSEEMARDERVYLIGQDLKYNVWGVTNGLNQKFGDGRVLHAPISENGFVSSALGSALVGSRPVVELTRGRPRRPRDTDRAPRPRRAAFSSAPP